MVHDFTGMPSSRTVQAPQLLVSQPMCVPVSPRSVRMKSDEEHARLDVGRSRSTPLTVTVTFIWRSSRYGLAVLERLGPGPAA